MYSGVKQHSCNRLIMVSQSISRMIWFTMTSQQPSRASRRLRKPLTHDTGNVVLKSHVRLPPRPLPDTGQRNLTLPRQTPSPKVHHNPCRRTLLAPPRAKEVLPSQGSSFPTLPLISGKMGS